MRMIKEEVERVSCTQRASKDVKDGRASLVVLKNERQRRAMPPPRPWGLGE